MDVKLVENTVSRLHNMEKKGEKDRGPRHFVFDPDSILARLAWRRADPAQKIADREGAWHRPMVSPRSHNQCICNFLSHTALN